MNIPLRLFAFLIAFFLSYFGLSQDTLRFHLEEVLNLAIEQSIDLKIAQSETVQQEAAFKEANLAFRPQLFFGATLPNLNRSIESRPLPNGSDAFVNRSTMYVGLGFDLNYQLEKTGGLLSVGSNVERLDVFRTNQFAYQRTYFINPINISYIQPLFTFNERRWQKKRLSFLYLEFKERYARAREEVVIQVIKLFKNVFLSYQRLNLAQRQIMETDSLLTIKNRLFDIGKSSRAEILRLSLDQKKHQQTKQSELLNWQQAQMELIDFLGLDRSNVILLNEPISLQDTNIPIDAAMEFAVNNKFVTTTQARTLSEVEAESERAQKNKDIDLNFKLSLGLNNSDEDFQNLFRPLLDREIFEASVRMPLTGHQKYKVRQQIAEERIKQVRLQQTKERVDLSREAFKLVKDFENLKQRFAYQEDRRETANEILQINIQQFLLGKATYTDLNLAIREREQAVLSYYNDLLAIIEQYYRIRKLCMYDFVNGMELSDQ